MRSLAPAFVFAFALAVAWAGDASARGYRIDQLPAGYAFECYMCHFRQPFTRLTVFGELVEQTLLFREDYPEELPPNFFVGDEGNVDWATVALVDSDGDGYTNGEELGDPLGEFVQLGAQPDFPFTRPDLPDDFPCGSGTVEGPEACDGDAFAGATCADFGLPGGALRCRDDCTIDPSGCTTCGDGVIDADEACDGPIEGRCPEGLVGAVRCVQCRLDESGCRPEPDAAPDAAVEPDALPVDAMGAVDAMPDAMPDAIAVVDVVPDAMPDAIAVVDGMSDAMPDAMTAADAIVDVAAVDARADVADARSVAGRASDCGQAPGGGGPGWRGLLIVLVVAAGRRACGRAGPSG